MGVDALAEKYVGYNPYVYCLGNPVSLVDPDGREIIAPSQDSKNLILKTTAFMFGKNHGYSFDGDKLIHNGVAPAGISKGQSSMFLVFNEALVNSKTKTLVKANQIIALSDCGQNLVLRPSAAASTFYEGSSTKIAGDEKSGTVRFTFSANQTILMSQSTVNNGTNAEFSDGLKSIGAEHALAHEFGHGIVNTIMNEMGGNFNGTDFNKMTELERSDWSIRFTNTLMKSQGNTLETGDGQHGQTASQRPKDSLKPINE
jgi:hypothetical protein